MMRISNLYITEPGAVLHFSGNRFEITYKNEMKRSIPSEQLECITLFGPVQISTQCMQKCLSAGIPVNMYSKGGAYYGKLISTTHVNTYRQRIQIHATENEAFSLGLAKRIIKAKIHNQAVVFRRYRNCLDRKVSGQLNDLAYNERMIDRAESEEQLMGYEGNAARTYFEGLADCVNRDFAFSGRNRRPPKDPFNSMLSLGYSLLLNEVYGEIEARGLNPYFGFLHKDREKHPTLASDLMEEWRPVIVDSMVMSLVNGREIKLEHFSKEEGNPGIYLTRDGMKIFLTKFENKLSTKMKYLSYSEQSISFRRGIGMQISRLIEAIQTQDAEHYEPIRIR